MSSYGDSWADIYDMAHSAVTEDISLWVEEAKASAGPVLELGCGTGRVAVPIAQAGIRLVGLDSSAAMLRLARAKARKLRLGADRLRFVRGDMRELSLGQRFPLVIIPFRSFQFLLSVADQCQSLDAIRRHLTPGGRLVMSLFVPDLERLTRHPSIPLYDGEITYPITGHRLLFWYQNSYDNFNQIVTVRTIIEEVDGQGDVVRKTYRDYQIRYSYRFEVQHLLAACGYDVVDVYGSFDREPLSESSAEMIWVATPAD
ncbi:MAG: class I SAM-dependent methyltransferase [Dehalococcoidia bacterium]|nr:class I SAM-dependent methyltransferase [Dehalococcoidia bacterium]